MSLQNVSLLKWGGRFMSFETSGRGLGSEMGCGLRAWVGVACALRQGGRVHR